MTLSTRKCVLALTLSLIPSAWGQFEEALANIREVTPEERAEHRIKVKASHRRLDGHEEDWHKKGDPSKDCEWVAAYSEARCGMGKGTFGVKGEDGSFAIDSCSVCQSEKPPSVGAFQCEESDGYDIVESDFHPDFPPKELIDVAYTKGDGFARDPELYDEIGDWFDNEFANVEYEPMEMTDKEKMMISWTATDYVEAFKMGEVNATEYTTLMVKRMLHYRMLNAFFVTSYDTTEKIIEQAEAIDAKVEAAGDPEAAAPFYGLPIPAKGTMSSIDFPGGAGMGILDGCYGADDAALLKLVKAANGVIMGKTNVPEFACSWQSMNHLNGVVRSAYNTTLTVCGSSGGSGSAVAAYIAPIAITEDTGGSTRCPAHANGNFGYDPARNKYPNDGNPGITRYQDQLGINTRTFDDILLFDMAVLNITAEHEAAKNTVDALDLADIKIGFPEDLFVTYTVPDVIRELGLTSNFDRRADASMRDALAEAKSLLSDGGMTVIEDDWPMMMSETLGANVSSLWHLIYGNGSNTTSRLSTRRFSTSSTTSAPSVSATDPQGAMRGSGLGSETQLRYCSLYQQETPQFWNAYFDEYDLDMIITPTQFTAAQKYSENAKGTIPMEVLQEDGSYAIEEIGATGATGSIHYSTFKAMHIGKVVIPVGLDSNGRPISFTVWGRAMPGELMFCDECSVDHDTEFLYKVKKVVDVLHAQGSSLARVDSTLAMGDVLA